MMISPVMFPKRQALSTSTPSTIWRCGAYLTMKTRLDEYLIIAAYDLAGSKPLSSTCLSIIRKHLMLHISLTIEATMSLIRLSQIYSSQILSSIRLKHFLVGWSVNALYALSILSAHFGISNSSSNILDICPALLNFIRFIFRSSSFLASALYFAEESGNSGFF